MSARTRVSTAGGKIQAAAKTTSPVIARFCAMVFVTGVFVGTSIWAAQDSVDSQNVPMVGVSSLTASEPTGVAVEPASIRVRLGDEPGWREPGFKDDDWDAIKEFAYPAKSDTVEPTTPAWFRFSLTVAPELVGVPIVLRASPYQSNLQIFLNGIPVATTQDLDPSTGVTPRCVVPRQAQNVVAIRWVPSTYRTSLSQAPRSFALFLRDYERVLGIFDKEEQLEHAYAWHRLALIAVFVVFCVFHFALYSNDPRRHENIFYCTTALFSALALACLHVSEVYHYDRAIWSVFYLYGFLALMPLSVVCGLGLFQLLLIGRTRRTLPVYLVIGVMAFVASFWYGNDPVHWFPVLLLPEIAWVTWTAHRNRTASSRWTALVVLVMASVIANALASLYSWDSESGFLRYGPWYFCVGFLLIVAWAFAREYSLDKKRIEAFAAELEEQVTLRTQELKAATTEISTLQGILPICMYCHKIRNDHQSWQQLEQYIQQHSEAKFSHGVCPDCYNRFYSDLAGQ